MVAKNTKPEVNISASKLKTFQSCSWQFYARYVLKLPDKTNTGALMGSLCHTIFECLLNPRHKHIYDTIVTEPASITNYPAVERHVRSYIKKRELPEECFDKIDTMIIVGLITDFFCKGGTILSPELAFSIKNKDPKYNINGMIDKPAEYNGKFVRIVDYKSSKKKFEGDELNVNVQAMMYSLAARHLWPHLTPIVDFLFLQFPNEPLQRLKFSESQLNGFETFLGQVANQMANFTEEDGKANMAKNQKLPGNGQGFKGPLLCGWAGKKGFVKTPDQLKADGVTPAFYCSYRFPFDYFAVCDETGAVIRSSKENNLKVNEEKGEFVVKKRYLGCPGFPK